MERALREHAERRAPRKTRGDRALLALEALAGVGVVAAIVGKAYGAAPTVFFIFASGATMFAGWSLMRAFGAWRDESLDVAARTHDLERETLEHEKLLLLQGIKELEADAAVGKVDPRDYQYLRGTAEARAVAIIERLKKEDAHWMRAAEDLLRAKLGGVPSSLGAAAAAPAAAAFVVASADEPADPSVFDDRPAEMSVVEGALSCAACQAKSELDARYCTGCGRPRQPQGVSA